MKIVCVFHGAHKRKENFEQKKKKKNNNNDDNIATTLKPNKLNEKTKQYCQQKSFALSLMPSPTIPALIIHPSNWQQKVLIKRYKENNPKKTVTAINKYIF